MRKFAMLVYQRVFKNWISWVMLVTLLLFPWKFHFGFANSTLSLLVFLLGVEVMVFWSWFFSANFAGVEKSCFRQTLSQLGFFVWFWWEVAGVLGMFVVIGVSEISPNFVTVNEVATGKTWQSDLKHVISILLKQTNSTLSTLILYLMHFFL